jgi:hypothetical protein
VTLKKEKKTSVSARNLQFPKNALRSPFKLAIFNKVKRDVLRFINDEPPQQLSNADVTALTNGMTDLHLAFTETEELFRDLEKSRYSNETVLLLIGQIYSTFYMLHRNFRTETYAEWAHATVQDIWRGTYGNQERVSLNPGGSVIITMEDLESLNPLRPHHGWLTDDAMTAAIATRTTNLHVPNIPATAAFYNDRDAPAPLSDNARLMGRVGLVVHTPNHWVFVAIDTTTRTYDILNSAEWADRNNRRSQRLVDLAHRYMRAQFPEWYENGAEPRRGNARSAQQSNADDCGMYVNENAAAFDVGNPYGEIIPTVSRAALATAWINEARQANPDRVQYQSNIQQ